MADDALNPSLPTALDPQRLASLQSLFPQVPAATPTVPSPGGEPDIMQEMIARSRQGGQAFGEERAQVGDIGGQIQKLIAEQQATPIPKMGWLDTQGQPQQGGFLHNLGRTLMAIGGSTTAGRNIQSAQYGPGIKRYEAETGARAKQIEELRGQQEEHEKLAGAAGGMVSKPITAAGSAMRGQAALSTASAKIPLYTAQAKAALAGIDLKRAAIDEKARHNLATELQQKVDELGRDFRQKEKDATEEDVARVLSGSREAIANEVAARNPSLWQQLQVELGWGATPQLPAAQPAQTPPAKAAGPAKPVAKGNTKPAYRGPDGKWYDAQTHKPI